MRTDTLDFFSPEKEVTFLDASFENVINVIIKMYPLKIDNLPISLKWIFSVI